jgi:NitT/TauT family transport system permease protein
MAYQESQSSGFEIPAIVRKQRGNLIRLVSISAALLLWLVASLSFAQVTLPSPIVVAQEIASIVTTEMFYYHLYKTFFRVIIGFVLALSLATALGIAMGLSDVAEHVFDIHILVGLTVPGMAIAMITLLMFGIGDLAAITAVFITILPFMAENMWEGSKNIDDELIRMGNAFNTDRLKMVREVVFPQLIPYILAASRYGLGLAWKVVVIAEMLGLGSGVGYQINEAFGLFRFEGVLAWTFAFTIVMFILEFVVIKRIERYLTAWRVEVEGGQVM